MTKHLFELCAPDLDAVAKAIAGGADRVELCRDLDTGGLTPDNSTILGAVEMARNAGRPFDVMVLIRQRPGDFVYTEAEKQQMMQSIAEISKLGVNGLVIGSLNPDGSIDAEWTKQATDAIHACGLSVTFHRAFDRVRDFSEALDTLQKIGVDRILASGPGDCVETGMDTLAMLTRHAAGRLIILPGGGVRSSNITKLHEVTGATEFHSSCRCKMPSGQTQTDSTEVERIANLIHSFT